MTLPPATPLNALAWQPMDTAPTHTYVMLWVDAGDETHAVEGIWMEGSWRFFACSGSVWFISNDEGAGPVPSAWAHKPAGPVWGGAA